MDLIEMTRITECAVLQELIQDGDILP